MARIYCYDGDCGLTANELLFVIATEVAMDEFGLDDVGAALSIVLGANIIPTRAKPGGAINNTSIMSIVMRRTLNNRKFPGSFRAPSLTGWFPPHLRWTRSIGGFIARATPVIGWSYTAYELGKIGYITVNTYNSIVDEQDQVF
ncbi:MULTISPECIES: STM2901 family protein [Pseudomonas syringae group]|uniref:STM2901 family protein n=1 Tax=Pseudomonas syringae group TaxID=136849 RepID=UPI0002089B06